MWADEEETDWRSGPGPQAPRLWQALRVNELDISARLRKKSKNKKTNAEGRHTVFACAWTTSPYPTLSILETASVFGFLRSCHGSGYVALGSSCNNYSCLIQGLFLLCSLGVLELELRKRSFLPGGFKQRTYKMKKLLEPSSVFWLEEEKWRNEAITPREFGVKP